MEILVPFETQSELIYFELSNFPCIQDEKTGFQVDISSNYDYKILPNGAWLLFFDIRLTIKPLSDFIYRVGYQFPQTNLTDEEIFDPVIVNYMVRLGIMKCIKEYKHNCEEFEVTPKEFKVPEESIQSIVGATISQYYDYRKQCDIENAYLINNIGVECDSDDDNRIIFLCTLLIVDEILYSHTGYESDYNREAFSNVVPMPKYNTLRMICRKIESEHIQLTFLENILFLQCLDCALQILLSDKADRMLSYLEGEGFTAEIKKAFFRLGTSYFRKIKESLIQSKARILNLEENHDWASLFR